MALDTILYKLKTQFFYGEHTPDCPTYTPMIPHTCTHLHLINSLRMNCMCYRDVYSLPLLYFNYYPPLHVILDMSNPAYTWLCMCLKLSFVNCESILCNISIRFTKGFVLQLCNFCRRCNFEENLLHFGSFSHSLIQKDKTVAETVPKCSEFLFLYYLRKYDLQIT